MPLDNYGYALEWDADDGDFTNYEMTFTTPVLWAPLRVSRGGVVSKAWSGHEVVDGWQTLVLQQVGEPFGFTLFADLLTYATAVHGGLDGEDTEIAVRADKPDGTFGWFNVIAHTPRLGTDYTHENSEYVRDLQLRYTIVNEYTPSDV